MIPLRIAFPFLVLGMLLLAGCSPDQASKQSPSSPAQTALQSTNTTRNPSATKPEEEVELIPLPSKLATFSGADSCKECHEEQHQSWFQTYHRSMTQLPLPNAVQADFNNITLTNAGRRFFLHRKDAQFWVRIEPLAPSPTAAADSQIEEMPIGLVSGSHHMQVFWVPNGQGNGQTGFPFTWLIPEKRWVPRNSTFIRPPEMEHRAESWNHVCSRCHATATQPAYDRQGQIWRTTMADLGIACEACHGPGERHVQLRRDLRAKGEKPNPKSIHDPIIQPANLTALRGSQVCANCHAMKWWDRREGWPEKGFSYRPGDDIEASTPIIRPKQLDQQPWLRNVLEKNPDILQDFFWPDGMIRVSGREYNGLIESPCYKSGNFSCLSCHSMHQSKPNDLLAKGREDNGACLPCHSQFKEPARLTAHTHHIENSSGSSCYNCHMPHTTYGVLSAIRSHLVTSPRVADQLNTGRPNACNLCHLDKSLGWTSAKLSEWYRQPPAPLGEEQNTLPESLRLATQGDAGQRALIAWHYAWPSALETSGKNWPAAVLALLLDDPYAAIRCLAERSLKATTQLLPSDYDYTLPANTRPPFQNRVLTAWAQHSAPGTVLPPPLDARDPASTARRLQELTARRNDRPIRLRE